MNTNITIVTAFFDIGRGSWSNQHFKRTANDYLNYFKNLAILENPMIVYTSADFIEKVLELRNGRPTTVIEIDFNKKFKHTIKKIDHILKSPSYQKRIPGEIKINPEYQSAEYVLVNNLKYYFVNSAIKNSKSNSLFAWVDFGFCRNKKTTHGIKEWKHSFDPNKMHVFTLKKEIILEDKEVMLQKALNNEVYFIGSMIVGSKDSWGKFYKLVTSLQYKYMQQNISDDDQGTMLMTVCEQPDLFETHSLYGRGWFSSFKLFNKGSSYINFRAKIKSMLNDFYMSYIKK